MATIANDGVRMQPYLVDAVLEGPDAVPLPVEPRVDRRVLSEATARVVARMMEAVVEEGGTGTRAAVEGYRVAGKTGTAQKAENGGYSATKRIGSFVGFLPADRPEIAIAVSIDTPTVGSKYGGIVAAPVFSAMGAFTMRYLGIEPDPPTVVVADPADPTKTVRVPAPPKPPALPPEARAPLELGGDGTGGWILPDFTGRSMRDAMAALQPTGVALQLDGYGSVTAQSPAAGSRVAAGDAVTLRLQ
jgi:cell division protein FtsI (penicillin-binding protein 3)